MKRICLICFLVLLLLLTACHPNKNEIRITEDYLTQIEAYETADIEHIHELVEITKPLLNISAKAFTSLEGWDFYGTHAQKETTLFGYEGVISVNMNFGNVETVSYSWNGSSDMEYYMLADTLVNNYGDPIVVQFENDNTTHKGILEAINKDTSDNYSTYYKWDVDDDKVIISGGYLAKTDYTVLSLMWQK